MKIFTCQVTCCLNCPCYIEYHDGKIYCRQSMLDTKKHRWRIIKEKDIMNIQPWCQLPNSEQSRERTIPQQAHGAAKAKSCSFTQEQCKSCNDYDEENDMCWAEKCPNTASA